MITCTKKMAVIGFNKSHSPLVILIQVFKYMLDSYWSIKSGLLIVEKPGSLLRKHHKQLKCTTKSLSWGAIHVVHRVALAWPHHSAKEHIQITNLHRTKLNRFYLYIQLLSLFSIYNFERDLRTVWIEKIKSDHSSVWSVDPWLEINNAQSLHIIKNDIQIRI